MSAPEVLKNVTNSPIIKMPGRKFPGILIQGDTFFTFLESVQQIESLMLEGDFEMGFEELSYFKETLESYLQFYEKVLSEKGMKTPYYRP